MKPYSGQFSSRVMLRSYSHMPRITAELQLTRDLVVRRSGVLGRLLPSGVTSFSLQVQGRDFDFDPKRVMNIGTKGTNGLKIAKSALVQIVKEPCLDPDHVSIDFRGERPLLQLKGREKVRIIRHVGDSDNVIMFVLTRSDPGSIELESTVRLQVLENISGRKYRIKEHVIPPANNFEILWPHQQNSADDALALLPNDSIFLPLGKRSGEMVWQRIIFDPMEVTQVVQYDPNPQVKPTEPLKVMLGKGQKPVLFQALSPEEQVQVLRGMGIDAMTVIPASQQHRIDQSARGLSLFPGISQQIKERQADNAARREAAAGKLVHRVDKIAPNKLASPLEFARTRIEPWISRRPDADELLAEVENSRGGKDSYLETVPYGFHNVVLGMAEYAFNNGYTVDGVELDRQFVWEIFAFKWLLRKHLFPRLAEEKGYRSRVSQVARGRDNFSLFAFTETGTLVEMRQELSRSGAPFVQVSLQRLEGRLDRLSEEIEGWPVKDVQLGEAIEISKLSSGFQAVTDLERTSRVVVLAV